MSTALYSDTAAIQTTTLDLDKVGFQYGLPVGLQHAKLDVKKDIWDMLTYKLSAYVVSEHLASDTQTKEIQFPQTWWDHAKKELGVWASQKPCRVLTRWFLAKYPAKNKTARLTVSWTRKATRPQSTLRVENLGPVVYQETSSHWLDWLSG